MPSMPLPPPPPLFTRRLSPLPRGHADMLALQLGESPLGGNRVTLLAGRDATQHAIGEAIDSAHDHVNADTALLGEQPLPLLARLARRCRAGVHVNLLYDSLDATARAMLLDAGVHLCERQPVSRRLLVADGRLGLVGEAAPGADAEDLLLRVEGPAVQRLQRLFIGHWQRRAGAAMEPARFFPPLAVAGTQRVAVASDDATGRRDGAFGALLGAVAAARSRITLVTGGRTPARRLVTALAQAARRGVTVDLLLPGRADARRALGGARRHYQRLLQSGARLWERGAMTQVTEACVIDGLWASIGTAAAEPGQRRTAGRADLVVLDDEFAARLEPLLRLQIGAALPVDAGRWARRHWWQRWRQALAERLHL